MSRRSAAHGDALVIGTSIGPFHVLDKLGEGGMGQVYKARDTRLDRTVAIKKSNERFSERFEREARAVAALNHPHICTLYDVGEDYLVMEYIDGQPIAGPLPVADVLRYAIQAADALDAAHRKGIVHRDLKPANMLLTKSGVKILDFGLAKFNSTGPGGPVGAATMTKPLTEAGSILGTLQYMSPEQLEGREADARSDIFSFGCVLYELLTGQRAFRASSQATLIASILDREPEPIAMHQPLVPPMLERIVRKCLAKDPDKRWQTAADLKSELEWVAESGSNPALPAPVAAGRRRIARLGWMVAAALAVLAALAAAFVLMRPEPAPPRTVRFGISPPPGVAWMQWDIPVVSPDGSRVIFGGTSADGARRFWIRSLDSIETRPIPGTEGATFPPAWSPDGTAIAFATGNGLRRLNLAAGSAEELGSLPAWGIPAWHSNGTLLFTRNSRPFEIHQIPAAGGDPKPVTTVAPEKNTIGPLGPPFHGFPWFLPDGRRFLFFDGGNPGLLIGSVDAPDTQPVATIASPGQFVPPDWLFFVRNTTLFAQTFDPATGALSGDPIQLAGDVFVSPPGRAGFSVSDNGVLVYRSGSPPPPSELVWHDRQGKRVGAVGERGFFTNPALSPDGRYLAVGRSVTPIDYRDIWVIDLVRGSTSRFTFDAGDDLNPVWSPDGSRIAFTSTRNGQRDIYVKSATGAGAETVLFADNTSKSLEDWSPDGRTLIFNVGTQHISSVPAEGDRTPAKVLGASFNQVQGKLSPDGRWIAYTSNENNRTDVFVQTFPPGGGKWQISIDGGGEPAWRADGRELFFMNGRRLYAVDVEATGGRFEAGTPRELFEASVLTGEVRRNRYVVSADGQRFLLVTSPPAADSTPMTVVLNWPAALPQ